MTLPSFSAIGQGVGVALALFLLLPLLVFIWSAAIFAGWLSQRRAGFRPIPELLEL